MTSFSERIGRAVPRMTAALSASALLTMGAWASAEVDVEPGDGPVDLPPICETHLGEVGDVDFLVVGPEGFFVEPAIEYHQIQEAIDDYAASSADGACIFVHRSDIRLRQGYDGFLINTEDFDKAGNVVIFGPFFGQPGLRVELDNRTGDFFDDGEAVVTGTGTISETEELDNVAIAGLTFLTPGADAINGVRLSSGVIENNILRGAGGESPLTEAGSSVAENAGIATESSDGASTASWSLQGNNVAGFERGFDLDGGADSVDVQVGGDAPQINQLFDNVIGIQTREGLHDYSSGAGIEITANFVQDNQTGVSLAGGQAQVVSNFIFANDDAAIRAGVPGGSLDDLTIETNLILGNGIGLQFDAVPASSDGLTANENIIAGNNTGIESVFLVDARFNVWWLGEDPIAVFSNEQELVPGEEPGGEGMTNLGPVDATDLTTATASPNYNNTTGIGDSATDNVRYWPWRAATSAALDDGGDMNANDDGGNDNGGLVDLFPLTELVPATPVPLDNVSTTDPDTLYSFGGGPVLVFDFGLENDAGFDTAEALQQQFDADGNESTAFALTPVQETGGFSIQDVSLSDALKSEVRAEAEEPAAVCSIASIILTGSFTSFVQHDPEAPPVVACGDFVDFELSVNHRRYRNLLKVDEVRLDGVPLTGTGCTDDIINQIDSCSVGPIDDEDVIIEFVISN